MLCCLNVQQPRRGSPRRGSGKLMEVRPALAPALAPPKSDPSRGLSSNELRAEGYPRLLATRRDPEFGTGSYFPRAPERSILTFIQ